MKKILVCGDLHGNHESLQNAIEKFENNDYDILVQLGDLSDSFSRSDEDILRTVKLAVDTKNKYKDRYIQLLGNHDLHYLHFPEYRCKGFRNSLQYTLSNLYKDYKDCFQVAYQIENYLFTHAGISSKWFEKHKEKINYYGELKGIDFSSFKNIDIILNAIEESKDRGILHEVGFPRGGNRFDYGGITWCDASEIMEYSPVADLHQIIGHTPYEKIITDNCFGLAYYDNATVTFCDVLSIREDFLTLKIEDELENIVDDYDNFYMG